MGMWLVGANIPPCTLSSLTPFQVQGQRGTKALQFLLQLYHSSWCLWWSASERYRKNGHDERLPRMEMDFHS